MTKVQPRQIMGKWRKGFALDIHTVSSIPIGHNEFGHMQFDTTRSEVGELLFKLKNRGDKSVIQEIAEAAVEFLKSLGEQFDVIVPVPPSTHRAVQPAELLAAELSKRTGIPIEPAVKKIARNTAIKECL